MNGFRLILLESSVRGETFFGKVNFKRADWSEPFFSFQLLDILKMNLNLNSDCT
jgi:hypothetical protein